MSSPSSTPDLKFEYLKFQSFSHAWATGVIAAALMGSEAFTVKISADVPMMTVKVGDRAYRILVEELQ